MDVDPAPMPVVPKEEKIDIDEDFEKKAEGPKRGRSRSLSKKAADKVDIRAKLERSRQSARECRARKKLRYQYLEELISETEKAVHALRKEMETLRIWANELELGHVPDGLIQYRNACIEKKFIKTEPGVGISVSPEIEIDRGSQNFDTLSIAGISKPELSLSPSSNMSHMLMAMGINNQSV